VNGERGGEPTRLGVAMVDMGTGLYSAVALLMALYERQRSGLGQYIDMTLYDCAVSLMHPHIINYNMTGDIPVATGNAHPNISPYETFRTRTVDIFIGAGNNRAFAKLCHELEATELVDDVRFLTNADRVKNREPLKAEIESRLMRIDGAAFAELLLAAGLPSGPIYNTAQVVAHPHTVHREMIVNKDWYKMTGIPIKFSRTPGSIRSLPPKFAEHTKEILAQAGVAQEQIDHLVDSGIAPLQRS
jgi:formyl-CoA transferase